MLRDHVTRQDTKRAGRGPDGDAPMMTHVVPPRIGVGRFAAFVFLWSFFFVPPAVHSQAPATEARLERLSKACANDKAKACFELGQLRRDKDPSAAAAAFEAACGQKHAQACNDLGDLHYFGRGVEQNRTAATALYEMACAADNAEACFSLGYVLSQMELGGNGDPRVITLFRKGCEGGYLDACSRYADRLIRNGDQDGALIVLKKTCNKGNEDSCLSLGGRLFWGNPYPVDKVAGMAAYQFGCDKGGARACSTLAGLHENDLLAQDPGKATDFYRKSCDLGQTNACERYGNALYRGIGIPADREAALSVFDSICKKWSSSCWQSDGIRNMPMWEVLCDTGDGNQCLRIGEALSRADAPIYDPSKARTFFEKGCNREIGAACTEVGNGFWNANVRDVEGALRFYERACNLNEVDGCTALGARLAGWPNIPADEPKAARAFAKGCALGDVRSCTERDRLAGLAADVEIEAATPLFQPPADDATPSQKPSERCVNVRTEINGQIFVDRRCNVQVINGFDILPGTAPWQALVERPKILNGQQLTSTQRVLCGGSLVAKGWIVTAAHCLYGDGKDLVRDGYRVRLGIYDVTEAEGLSYPIIQVVKHPQFQRGDPTFANDIALIRYDITKVQKLGATLYPVRTIKLDNMPVGQRQIFAGMTAYAYGWGWTQANNGQASNILKGVKLALRTETDCTKLTRFSGALVNSVLCAGGPAGEQACSGDSGGPLVYYGDEDRTPTLIGVVSAGKRCGTMGEPSRYTRIARVTGWIQAVISGTAARR